MIEVPRDGIKIKLKEEKSKLQLCIEVIDGLKKPAKFTESICGKCVLKAILQN